MSGNKVPPDIQKLVLDLVNNQMKQIRKTLRAEVELIEEEKRENAQKLLSERRATSEDS